MLRTWLLLASLLLVPLATAGTASVFAPDDDHPWVPSTGKTLEWAVAGCPEMRTDVVAGMQQVEDALAQAGTYPRFERRLGVEPDAQALRAFADPNSGTLLVQDITGRAGADLVIGCVSSETFSNITATHGFKDVLGITFFSYTWDPGQDVHLFTAAVIIVPEGQMLQVEGCHDPQPVGHELRRVSVMHEALHAAGLGTAHARDGGVFEELGAADNRSCSAWWVPRSEEVGKETVDRLKAQWGARPGPGVFGTVAGSMSAHTGWWVGVPLTLLLAAGAWVGYQRLEERKADRKRVVSGIRRLDGTVGVRRSTTEGINRFRPDEHAVAAPPEPEAEPEPELPGWGYANRSKYQRE